MIPASTLSPKSYLNILNAMSQISSSKSLKTIGVQFILVLNCSPPLSLQYQASYLFSKYNGGIKIAYPCPFQVGKIGRKKRSWFPSKSETQEDKFHQILRFENNPLWLDSVSSTSTWTVACSSGTNEAVLGCCFPFLKGKHIVQQLSWLVSYLWSGSLPLFHLVSFPFRLSWHHFCLNGRLDPQITHLISSKEGCVSHILGVPSRACFLIICNMDMLRFSNLQVLVSFCLTISFSIIFLLPHFTIGSKEKPGNL